MSEMALTTSVRPALSLPLDRPKQTPRVKGKLFKAIELMVFEGLPLDEAAKGAGLTTFALRQAIARPHVLAHLKARRVVFRASLCAANDLRLAQIRDAADNMPAVNAIKLLEQIDSDAPGAAAGRQPGITIVIQGASEPKIAQTIEHDEHMVNPQQTTQDE